MIFLPHFEPQASNFEIKYRKHTIPAETVNGFCIMPLNSYDNVPRKKYRYLEALIISYKLTKKWTGQWQQFPDLYFRMDPNMSIAQRFKPRVSLDPYMCSPYFNTTNLGFFWLNSSLSQERAQSWIPTWQYILKKHRQYRVKQSLPFKHVGLLGRIQRRAPVLITGLKHLSMNTGLGLISLKNGRLLGDLIAPSRT